MTEASDGFPLGRSTRNIQVFSKAKPSLAQFLICIPGTCSNASKAVIECPLANGAVPKQTDHSEPQADLKELDNAPQ